MIELNLLPDVKLQYVHAQKSRRRVISIASVVGLVAVGAVVLLAVYTYAVQPVRGLVVDGSIKDKSKQLTDIKDLDDYLTIQQQLAALPDLHKAKPIYSRMISYLPKLNPSTPNNVRITRLSVDATADTNALTLEAYAPSYTAVTVFESTLKSARFVSDGTEDTPLFQSASVTNTALGQDASGNKVVTFTVTLTANPAAFDFATTGASVTVPNRNATNSAQNVPGEIFAASGGN